MSSKHTPGPWITTVEGRIEEGPAFHVCFNHGAGLCEVAEVLPAETREGRVLISEEQAKANARLIAAAPEMLGALRVAFSAMQALAGKDDKETLMIKSAIAKAEGRE